MSEGHWAMLAIIAGWLIVLVIKLLVWRRQQRRAQARQFWKELDYPHYIKLRGKKFWEDN